MQAQKRGRNIAPTLPHRGTRRMWVVSTKPRPLYRRSLLEAGWASGLSGRKENLASMGLDPGHSSPRQVAFRNGTSIKYVVINTFTAIVDLSRCNNSCLKSPASTLVDLTFQSRAHRSFSLNQLRNLSL